MKNSLETKLGYFVVLAVLAAIVIIELVGGADIFQRGYRVNTHFDSVQELKVGDSVYIPRGTVHRNQNLTDKPARSIELVIIDKDKPQSEVTN